MRHSLLAIVFVLSACAHAPLEPREIEEKGVDQVACVGFAPRKLDGFEQAANHELLVKAQMGSGAGGVCAARVFRVTKPVSVYRVYDAAKGSSSYGRWWTFDRPAGARDAYRSAYGICAEWSALDTLITCQIKAGTEIVVGTTQSATCQIGAFAKTSHIQVFIPNDRKAERLLLENCVDSGSWPQRPQ